MQDKRDADRRLLHNLYILIEATTSDRLRALRYQRAINYYEMVAMFGERAFLKSKEAAA